MDVIGGELSQGYVVFDTVVTASNYTRYEGTLYGEFRKANCEMLQECVPTAGCTEFKGAMRLTLLGTGSCMTMPKCRFQSN
ncbi:MAG TPA: hypothetical protein VJC17_02865 [Candidatus Dojkabacteria bacterium]|nr:hypothetical protein [Candidatus Dojkabacteria bacterium]